MTPGEIIAILGLQPHPKEGGYFAESYRSEEGIPRDALPKSYSGHRSISTAIYYLLIPETFSEMHRLPGDELFHLYMGDPVEMLQLWPDGTGKVVEIGTDLAAGQRPQVVVPGGVWQGSRLKPGGKFALMGTTMAPGFDYRDYERGNPEALTTAYPGFEDLIRILSKE